MLTEIRQFLKDNRITVVELARKFGKNYSYVNHRLLGYQVPDGEFLVELRTHIDSILEERKNDRKS